MNAVVKAGEQSASILEIIARAAQDPNTDVNKLERLLQMAREVRADDAKAAYYADLAEMQDELPSIRERGEIKIGPGPSQKYAYWEDINSAIKPIMKKHGFAISFRTGIAEGKITVTGVLSHRAGHAEQTTIHLPSDTSGSKNAVQAVGSSTSYGKRYTAAALLNITTGGEDDNGNGAGGNGPITGEQLDALQDLIARSHSDIEKFCKYMGVDALVNIPVGGYQKATEALNFALDAWQKKQPKGAR